MFSQGNLANSPDFLDPRLLPIDWPCPKMVGCKFLAAEPHGVIPSGPSKDKKLAKNSVFYGMLGKMKGKFAIFSIQNVWWAVPTFQNSSNFDQPYCPTQMTEGLKINILGPLATCVGHYGLSKFELLGNVGTAHYTFWILKNCKFAFHFSNHSIEN
jgi:hypothetical protein